MKKYIRSRLRFSGIVILAILVSMVTLIGCGCVSAGSDSSDNDETFKTNGVYIQKGGIGTRSSQAFTASCTNENGIKITDGGTFTLSDSTVTKTGDSFSNEKSGFYGLNAGVLAKSGSIIELTNCTVSTNGSGASGVFATGSGSSVTLSDVRIETSASSSRGVCATRKGTITCTCVNITTAGQHCVAIATDYGGGTITFRGGTVSTAGEDSPGIYSTGNVTVTDSIITAAGSEAAVIQGKNSISLTNVTLSGAKKCGAMLYQSISGDAEESINIFTMNGGSLKAAVGPLFYVTNTQSEIELKGADLIAKSGILLTACADRWGNAGSNGGVVTFKAENETLNGNIICDNISSITAILQNSTILTGSINADNTANSIALILDSTSTWNVTGTSYLTNLTDEDSTLANIKDNGNTIYYNSSSGKNSWLEGKTFTLSDGGHLTPIAGLQ